MHLLQTHERRGERVVRVSPYVRIAQRGGPTLYLKEGQVYTESGKKVDQLPPWFEEELKKISSKVLAEVGFTEVGPKRGRGRPSKEEQARKAEIEAAKQELKVDEDAHGDESP